MRRGFEKLPTWANVLLMVAVVPASAWYIAHFGFWHFILRMIFSPEL